MEDLHIDIQQTFNKIYRFIKLNDTFVKYIKQFKKDRMFIRTIYFSMEDECNIL